MCGAGEDDPSRGSYVWMTVVISLLPLAMLGAIVGWVVVKVRRAEAADETPTAKTTTEA